MDRNKALGVSAEDYRKICAWRRNSEPHDTCSPSAQFEELARRVKKFSSVQDMSVKRTTKLNSINFPFGQNTNRQCVGSYVC